MNLKKFLSIYIIPFIGTLVFAQDTPILLETYNNNELADMEELDSMAAHLFYKDVWFQDDSIVQFYYGLKREDVPQYDDSTLLEMMQNLPFTFDMSYNNVINSYIDQFSINRRLFIAKALGLSEHYFPYYEEVFDKNGMPTELKYLSVIESLLDPKARSYVGATGLWQFMLRTGQMYGLEVNSFIDERSDPVLATNAAAHLLSDLYNIYNDWQLAIAAYNAGPGNVNKAIAKAGGKKDFWSIRPYLPKETQNYVPLYIACAFVMEYHEKFDIFALRPDEQLFHTDSVRIYNKVSLDYIAHNLEIDKDYLALINPSLKTNIIPKSEEGFALQLPYEYIGQFAAMEEVIMNDTTIAEIEAEIIEEPEYIVYRVKSGDTLGHIASRYGTSVSKIKQWNGLSSDFLNIGQKLIIY